MTTHTPGPWREGAEGNLRVYGPDARGENSGLIAVVFKGRANARLIAAAPDLLAACKAMVAELNDDLPPEACVAWDAAVAAIAKAEGR